MLSLFIRCVAGDASSENARKLDTFISHFMEFVVKFQPLLCKMFQFRLLGDQQNKAAFYNKAVSSALQFAFHKIQANRRSYIDTLANYLCNNKMQLLCKSSKIDTHTHTLHVHTFQNFRGHFASANGRHKSNSYGTVCLAFQSGVQ